MTIQDLMNTGRFEIVSAGNEPDKEITGVFCCDLLSIAMSRGIEGAAWVTVMGNINTLAVMTLTDMACIVLAENAAMDETGLKKAEDEGFTVLRTKDPIYPAARYIDDMISS